MTLPKPVFLVGSGHAHPTRQVTSTELERVVPGIDEGWSEKYLGMKSRRVLDVEGGVNSLLVRAVGDALDATGWSGELLDVIVCGTVFPDQTVPGAASYVAKAHNPAAVAFDLSAACASFIYALSTVRGMLQTDAFTRAAVCSGEHPTAYVDYTDPYSCIFWGDAAGAVLVTSERPAGPSFELVDVVLNGDHEYPERVFVPRSGYFRSDARYSFGQVMKLGSSAVLELLERNEIGSDALVGVAYHQASRRVLAEFSRLIDLPVDRQWHNYEWAGNQSAAGVVTAFSAGWDRHRDELRDGDHVVLAAVGGGYVGGAVLLRWTT